MCQLVCFRHVCRRCEVNVPDASLQVRDEEVPELETLRERYCECDVKDNLINRAGKVQVLLQVRLLCTPPHFTCVRVELVFLCHCRSSSVLVRAWDCCTE
jgi:hypothetical protein